MGVFVEAAMGQFSLRLSSEPLNKRSSVCVSLRRVKRRNLAGRDHQWTKQPSVGPRAKDGSPEGPQALGWPIRKTQNPSLKLRGRMWRKEQDGNSVIRTGIQDRAYNRNKVGTSQLEMEQELRREPEPG